VRSCAADQRDAEDGKLMLQVNRPFIISALAESGALAYLKKRGAVRKRRTPTFKHGYANRTSAIDCRKANRIEGAAIRGRLQKLGLYPRVDTSTSTVLLSSPSFNDAARSLEVYGRKMRR